MELQPIRLPIWLCHFRNPPFLFLGKELLVLRTLKIVVSNLDLLNKSESDIVLI